MLVQPGLCRTWSETQIVGFLTHRLSCHFSLVAQEKEKDSKFKKFKKTVKSRLIVQQVGAFSCSFCAHFRAQVSKNLAKVLVNTQEVVALARHY